MTTAQHRSTFHVRRVWFGAVIDEMQNATGRLVLSDRIDIHAFLKTFPQSLPPARCSAERFILESLLQRFAGQTETALHARVHQGTRNRACSFVPTVFLESFFGPRRMDPAESFRVWLDAFFKRFDEVHPVSAATRAAHLLRERYRQAWDVATLSTRVHTTTSRLTRTFRREYGLSPRDYLRLVRLVMALDRVRHEKIEATALDLGYRSRKNFNQAFKKVTGMTPTAFRELPQQEAQRIIDAARMMLSAPQSTARMRLEWSSHRARPPRAVAADSSRS